MAEYIEREALLAAYDKAHVGPAGGARKLIEEAPAADVAPVVRCKDCKRFEPHCNGKAGLCPKRKGVARADDFCSYGERKEADSDER